MNKFIFIFSVVGLVLGGCAAQDEVSTTTTTETTERSSTTGYTPPTTDASTGVGGYGGRP